MAPNPDLACEILTNIGELWLEEEFCDLTINIDDFQLRCHKFHLSANSAFFKTLLRSEKTDGFTNSISHVTIRGITPEIFGLVLEAVYKGENCVDENNVIQVWHAAHELQIDVLVSKCEDFVMANMTLNNYENICHSSILLESARVKDFAVTFIAKHIEKFRKTSLFLELPSNFLIDIVSSEALVVGAREGLVDSILMWAKHKSEQNVENDDNTLEMKAADLENQTEKDKQCVEIMFSQPPAGLEDNTSRRQLRQTLQETERREESLGKLLNLAKLEQTSPDYLKSLVDNDWLMGNKEARKVVWAGNINLLTTKPPTVDKCIDVQTTSPVSGNLCKDTVVYKLFNSDNILVHRGTTGKRHRLTADIQDILDSPLLNTLYNTVPACIQSTTADEPNITLLINGRKMTPADLKLVEDTSRPVVIGNYLYDIYSNTEIRRIELTNEKDESKSWHFVGKIPLVLPLWSLSDEELIWTAVHGETIIVSYEWKQQSQFFNEDKNGTYMSLYSFDSITLSVKYLGGTHSRRFYDGPLGMFVYMNDEMCFLQRNDQLWKVSSTSAPGQGFTKLTTISTGGMQVYSVIEEQNGLIIFSTLPADESLPTESKDLDLNLKFLQVWPQNNKCRHVWLPQSCIWEEV